jgi:hypothetical protein
MIVSGYIPSQQVENLTATDDLKTAVGLFRSRFGPDVVIEAINDRPVVGLCEACGLPIFEGEPYVSNPSAGEYIHLKCPAGKP